VDVGAQEEAVVKAVLAFLLHWKDVRGVQDGEGLLSRHGAAPAVVIQSQELEGALAQAPQGGRDRPTSRALPPGGRRYLP
jgi:hypothetical protein